MMVSLWQKLWDFRNWGVDTPRSRARAPGRLRSLTLPARQRTSSRSCRPQLEPLEDRLTPARTFLNFAPLGHVAVNPQPLPPGIQIEIDPYKNMNFPTVGMSTQQEHIAAFLSKQINLLPATPTSSPSDPWFLQVFYSLDATVTENSILPTPFPAGTCSDTFSLTS